jgi:chromosome partitioning protein
MSHEYFLRNALAGVAKDYDFVLIDCPPSLGIFTTNAYQRRGRA